MPKETGMVKKGLLKSYKNERTNNCCSHKVSTVQNCQLLSTLQCLYYAMKHREIPKDLEDRNTTLVSYDCQQDNYS